jgi:hypothetical protein
VNAEGPQLALLARLSEAAIWDESVRRHETDPWAYMRRKLNDAESPLRAYKAELFAHARENLLADLSAAFAPPGALESHKEVFEGLLVPSDFADLSFHLHPSVERGERLEGALAVLEAARVPTLFDLEALPPAKRGRSWEARVQGMAARLGLEAVGRAAARGELGPFRRAYLARRLRRGLGEYLSVTRGDAGLRAEITPFMLARLEAAAAAALRVLNLRR